MTTTPLPPPDTHCFDEDTNKDVWRYSAELVEQIVKQARADLEAENARLREALQAIVQSWDNNTFCRERFVKSELGDYWAPASAMVNSETIAAARAALEKQP